MEKETYTKAQLEIVRFETADVITSSPGDENIDI